MSNWPKKTSPQDAITGPYLCSTHHTLAPHLLFLHKLNITSTDCTSTETREKNIKDQVQAGNYRDNTDTGKTLTACWYPCKN